MAGKIQGGKDAEIGTYVYAIEGKNAIGEPFNKNGSFLLLR